MFWLTLLNTLAIWVICVFIHSHHVEDHVARHSHVDLPEVESTIDEYIVASKPYRIVVADEDGNVLYDSHHDREELIVSRRLYHYT